MSAPTRAPITDRCFRDPVHIEGRRYRSCACHWFRDWYTGDRLYVRGIR